ncbi:hypothetical protein VKT23_012111 [Stygiomarasmius scandens]|uniref:Oxidase ustYa n=1 Tax=Marasmiellus scandens TaxID=2682957 RepID=A0ABR1J7F6_9AGAR
MKKSPQSSNLLLRVLLCLLIGINLSLTILLRRGSAFNKYELTQEILDNDTIPRYFPVDFGSHPIRLPLEESVHYSTEHSPVTDAEWAALTPGDGLVYLGNPPRVYTATMFHQLRCLDILRSAMNNHYHAEAVPQMPELAQHCLNYIRQTITCTGDVHISDTLCHHGHPEVREDPLICRDWTRAYEALEGNQREYFKSSA